MTLSTTVSAHACNDEEMRDVLASPATLIQGAAVSYFAASEAIYQSLSGAQTLSST